MLFQRAAALEACNSRVVLLEPCLVSGVSVAEYFNLSTELLVQHLHVPLQIVSRRDHVHRLSELIDPLVECVESLIDCVESLIDCVEPLIDCVEPLIDCVESLIDCVESLIDEVEPHIG